MIEKDRFPLEFIFAKAGGDDKKESTHTIISLLFFNCWSGVPRFHRDRPACLLVFTNRFNILLIGILLYSEKRKVQNVKLQLKT